MPLEKLVQMNERLAYSGVPAAKSFSTPKSLLLPGRNCVQVAHVKRAALLVDADNYFRAFAAAALQARHSIILLGWDFDSRTLLRSDAAQFNGPPSELGPFLNYLARRRRKLKIYILNWDYPMIFGTDREFPPLYGVGWKPRRRVHLRYDNTHPVGGSHHQKVVVIDDVLAFSGGIDLTTRRWDTCRHSPDDHRRTANGHPYPPFHDVMAMVEGEAAQTLGLIARERWWRATGEHIPAAATAPDPWPAEVGVDIAEVTVGISRTLPPSVEEPAVREVESLYLDMIAAAKRYLYIENQYFTAHKLADALAARLQEPAGPEIILVLRLLSHGWLEEHTMQALRTRLVKQLRAADRWGRFGVYFPHVPGLTDGTCLDVHSKVMVVDDEWLRIGSANLCNRSMGVDTECDLTFEARGEPRVRAAAREFRTRLLAEHLGVKTAQVEQAYEQTGSLNGAIAALRGEGRTLMPLEVESRPEIELSMATIADPEQPVSLERLVEEFAPNMRPDHPNRRRASALAIVILVLAGLTVAWRHTPLAEWLTADRISALADNFALKPWAPLMVFFAYTPACIVMFPRPLITLFAVLAFGAWMGFVYSMSGILMAAFITYIAGRWMDRATVRRLAGPKLNRVSEILRRRGLIAVTAVRLLPVAPFAIEGIVAGAIRIKLWQFLLGTALGMLPGTLTTTVFGDQVEAALRDPGSLNYGVIATVIVGLIALMVLTRRWFESRFGEAK